jgi:hypothetical protein
MITEAAKMVQLQGWNKVLGLTELEKVYSRTFWVVYTLEKRYSFFAGKTSVSYQDFK